MGPGGILKSIFKKLDLRLLDLIKKENQVFWFGLFQKPSSNFGNKNKLYAQVIRSKIVDIELKAV